MVEEDSVAAQAGSGSRTHAKNLEGSRATVTLHPRDVALT
jgi:hypothetical protein